MASVLLGVYGLHLGVYFHLMEEFICVCVALLFKNADRIRENAGMVRQLTAGIK